MAKQSIFGRISTLIRANVNAMIDAAEDPQKMLDQLVRDYTNNIAEAEAAIAETIGQLRLLERDNAEDKKTAEEWGNKAIAASRKGDELRAAGADMGNLCACNKLKGLIDAVTAGGGIALLPQTMVARQLQSGELALVPGNLAGQTLDFAIAVHRNQSQPAVLGWVAELLRLSRLAPIGAPPPA